MILKTDKYRKILNEFFSRLGIETAPSDFTVNVMNRLGLETAVEPVRLKPAILKLLSGIFVILMFLTIPFGSYIIYYTNRVLSIIASIDYSIINRFFASFVETIEGYPVTITGCVILILTMLFFLTMIIVNIRNYIYKTQMVSVI